MNLFFSLTVQFLMGIAHATEFTYNEINIIVYHMILLLILSLSQPCVWYAITTLKGEQGAAKLGHFDALANFLGEYFSPYENLLESFYDFLNKP